MEATRIIAVRHGETAWNVDTRIQGQLDIGLNENGIWQAQRAALALAGDAVSAIYSSDLQRARHTADAIARGVGLPVVPEPGLRERCFGAFEGRTFKEIEQDWPEHALHWRRRVPEWTPPEGGESLLALRERVQSTIDRLAARHSGELIVLVAHGGVLDALYRLATGQPVDSPRTWQLLNGAINRLLWSAGRLSVVGWSDSQHLERTSIDENNV